MKRLILFLCATLLCGAAALAQTYQETVYLKNGSIIKGTVLEQEAGGNIKIMTSDGSIFVYKSDEVQRITKEAVSSSRSKSSKGTASADGEAFRGWRVSPGLGIGTTFGDYAMASGVLEFGLGKDVSDQIYLGFGAQGSIPFKEGVDPSFSAFLENRIYFPSSSSVSFLLRDRLAFHPDFDHDNHSAGLVVAPGVMFPLSPSLDMVLTGGYQLGILLDGGTASHSLLFNATFDFHRRSAKKERDLAPYRRKGIEIGGGIGVANTTYLNESRGEGSVIWDPLMALFIGYRFNPHISLGIEGCLGAFTFVPDTDAISTGMESTAPAFFAIVSAAKRVLPLHEKYTTATFPADTVVFSEVTVPLAAASFEQPSPSATPPAAAPMFLMNSFLFIFVFLLVCFRCYLTQSSQSTQSSYFRDCSQHVGFRPSTMACQS